MNKFFTWIGGLAVLLVGAYFASNARAHKQRAGRLTESQLKKEYSNKSGALEKAKQLGIKADTAMQKSKEAAEKSRSRQLTLENRNETSMADRVKSFNDSL